MSIIATVSGGVFLTDSVTGAGPSKPFANVTNIGLSSYSYLAGQSISTSPTSITFPVGISLLQFVYIRNVGVNLLTATWTPNGGGSNVVLALTVGANGNGGFITFLEPDLTKGISALSLQATTAATFADIIIAG